MNKASYLYLLIILVQLSLTIGCAECRNPGDIDSILGRLNKIVDYDDEYLDIDDDFLREQAYKHGLKPSALHQYFNNVKQTGKTPQLDIVKDLIELGNIDLTAKDKLGRNIIHAALDAQCNLEIIQYLVEQLETKYPKQAKIILNAIEEKEETMHPKTPFLYATDCFDTSIVKFLVDHGVNPREIELKIALEDVIGTEQLNHVELFKYLLSINDRISTATSLSLLDRMKETSRYTFLEYLLEKLSQDGNFEVNSQDIHGDTLLHGLASCGDEKNTRFLIEKYHPNINIRNITGETPLIVAVKKGNAPVVSTLLSAGSDPTLPDNNGELPFEIAERELQKHKDNNRDRTHNTAPYIMVRKLAASLKNYKPSN